MLVLCYCSLLLAKFTVKITMGTYPACYNLIKNDCKDSVDNQTQDRWKMTHFTNKAEVELFCSTMFPSRIIR